MPKKKEKTGLYHSCYCTAYNGNQCYNCLNGAHRICEAGCKELNAKRPGLALVFKGTAKSKHRFKSLEGAVRGVRQRDRLIRQYHELSNELYSEIKLIARLASDKPEFSNPLDVIAAKKVRDKYLPK